MYKLYKTSPIENLKVNISTHFRKTAYNVAMFAVCGIATGIACIAVKHLGSEQMATTVIDNGGISTILFGVPTLYFGHRALKSYKEEKPRWDAFIAEFKKEQEIKRNIIEQENNARERDIQNKLVKRFEGIPYDYEKENPIDEQSKNGGTEPEDVKTLAIS